MRVGVVASWGLRCGLAELAQHFVSSVEDEIEVVKISFPKCFKWKVFENLDAVVFFYHPFYCRAPELRNWIPNVKALTSAKLFMQLTDTTRDRFNWSEFADYLDGVIVFRENMVTTVTYIPEKTFVIPHGIPVLEPVTKQEARKQVKIDGYPIVSTFGFPSFIKNYDIIILAMRIVQKQHSNALLVMCCSSWLDENVTMPCAEYLKDLISATGTNALFLEDKWEPEEHMPYLQASDIFVSQRMAFDIYSQSGSCLQGIAARRPTIIGYSQLFYQLRPYALCVNSNTPEVLAKAIGHLCEHEEMHESLKQRAEQAYEKFNWNVLRLQYLSILERSLNGESLKGLAYRPKGKLDVQQLWKPEN